MKRALHIALHVVGIGIASIVLGALWINLAANHDWPATPGWLPDYFHADGERGYDLWDLEMQLVTFVFVCCVWISVRLLLRPFSSRPRGGGAS
jgi:hypothetical protein